MGAQSSDDGIDVHVFLGGEARQALHELQSATGRDARDAVGTALIEHLKLRRRLHNDPPSGRHDPRRHPLWILVDQSGRLRRARLRPLTVALDPDRKLLCWARHADRHRRWQLTGVLAPLTAAVWLGIGFVR
jgi:hypothetical protein